MEIREGNNYVEIEVVDRVPENLPSAGDVELSVVVASDHFSGQGFAWVAAPALASFLVELRILEERRLGTVILTGLSAQEFQLRIWSVNRRGHVAIGGLVTKQVQQEEGRSYHHIVDFGFEFDPTLLPKVLSGFQAIVEGHG